MNQTSQLSYAFHSSIYTDPTFKPKRFALSDENQAGTLTVGRRRYPLKVTEMSARDFVALMPVQRASKLKLGSIQTLRVIDGEWRVSILTKNTLPDGWVQLELEQVEEIYEPTVPRTSFFTSSRSVALSARDPLLPLAITATVIITILILPSLGGQWGTSQSISDGAQSLWKSVTTGFKR